MAAFSKVSLLILGLLYTVTLLMSFATSTPLSESKDTAAYHGYMQHAYHDHDDDDDHDRQYGYGRYPGYVGGRRGGWYGYPRYGGGGRGGYGYGYPRYPGYGVGGGRGRYPGYGFGGRY